MIFSFILIQSTPQIRTILLQTKFISKTWF